MRAVPFFEHGYTTDVLQYVEDFPDPAAYKDETIVDVQFCGLNHLDIWTRQGIDGKKIILPHICGCDIVGTIKKGTQTERVAVYPGISCGKCIHCMRGQQNFCSQFAIIGGLSNYNGGYAEKIAVPTRNIIKIPDSMKNKTAAALPVSYLTAWNMLLTNGASKDKTILVYGATSGVGMATIQLAKVLGAHIICTTSNKKKYNFAKKIGADDIIDRSTQDIVEEVDKITEQKGVDIVIDHVGAATWHISVAILKQGGKMAVCGMTSGNEATIPVRRFYSKQITMTGALLGNKLQFIKLISFITRNRICPIIDSIFELEHAAKAQKKMEAGLHSGKILLNIEHK
jgi:NADPH:quinone reductase-like Zn-dependent oxidoreductase